MDQLPLEHPQQGTWPTIQACVLTRIEHVTFQFTGQHPAAEPHQSGPVLPPEGKGAHALQTSQSDQARGRGTFTDLSLDSVQENYLSGAVEWSKAFATPSTSQP